jgi:hypothetical protein
MVDISAATNVNHIQARHNIFIEKRCFVRSIECFAFVTCFSIKLAISLRFVPMSGRFVYLTIIDAILTTCY